MTYTGSMTATTTDPIGELLKSAGEERRQAEDERTTASRLLREAVREAAAAGWPKTRIAEAAGVSRQTVHEMVGKA